MDVIDLMIRRMYMGDKKYCFDENKIKEFEEEIDKVLDRDIPVLLEYRKEGYYLCPMCDSKINGIYKYCPYCGQKIEYDE